MLACPSAMGLGKKVVLCFEENTARFASKQLCYRSERSYSQKESRKSAVSSHGVNIFVVFHQIINIFHERNGICIACTRARQCWPRAPCSRIPSQHGADDIYSFNKRASTDMCAIAVSTSCISQKTVNLNTACGIPEVRCKNSGFMTPTYQRKYSTQLNFEP